MGGSALTSRVQIRNAEERDLEQVEALEIANFSRPWPIDMLRRQLPSDRHEFLVAAQGDKVLGYIGMLHVMDEGYISNVAVDETVRRAGIGSMLVEGMLQRCEALSLLFVTLEVRASNDPAIQLYDHHGFEVVGRRKGYYEAPREDAILMTKFWKEVEEEC